MPFNAKLEFFVNFERFRNIDLLCKGFYFIKVSLRTSLGIVAPVTVSKSTTKNRKSKYSSRKCLTRIDEGIDAEVNRAEKLARTKVFVIQYQKQEVVLDEIFLFRTVIDIGDLLSKDYADLILELYFHDFKTEPTSISQFKKISQRRLRLVNISYGVNMFYPLAFEVLHFGVAHLNVHCVWFDLTYCEKNDAKNTNSKLPKSILQKPKKILYDQYIKSVVRKLHPSSKVGFYGKTAPVCLSAHLLRTALGSLFTTEQRFSQLLNQLEQHTPKINYCATEKTEEKRFVELVQSVFQPSPVNEQNGNKSDNPVLPIRRPSIPLDVKKAAKLQMDSMTKITPRIPRSFLRTIEDVVEKMIYRYYNVTDSMIEYIPYFIENECSYVTDRIKRYWKKLYSKSKLYPETVFSELMKKFFNLQQSKWEECQKTDKVDTKKVPEIEDTELFVDPKFFRVLFDNHTVEPKNHEKPESTESSTPEYKFCNGFGNSNSVAKHLVLFVPGWNGCSQDFKILKNYMEIFFPNCEFHPCVSADGQENYSIEELADKISEEVKQKCLQGLYCKLSFVCHSMGALVARSALSKLKNYAPQFYSFISLGSPHLGTVHRTNILIDSALWFLRTCKGVKCLQQLAFKDSINEKETFLYNLSSEPFLGDFKNIVFVSSPQDPYVSHYSATVTQRNYEDPLIAQMIKNFENCTKSCHVLRCFVKFVSRMKSDSTLDKLTGKVYHTAYLQDLGFINGFINLHKQYFL